MSILEGVTQCWQLGPTCEVNWAAWAAIGTFVAAGVALYIAGAERRKRRADEKEAASLAFISLWPRFHRAQARVGDIAMHLRNHVVPDEDRQASIAQAIDSLEEELAAISAVANRLGKDRAGRVVGAVALAGQIARQTRRMSNPVRKGPPIELWASELRGAWLADCEFAIGELLAMASESQRAGDAVTGRKVPITVNDRWE